MSISFISPSPQSSVDELIKTSLLLWKCNYTSVFVLSVTVQTAWSSARISRVIIVYTCFASESWVSSHSTSYHSNHYIYTVSSSLFSLFYVHWSIAASVVMYSGLTTTILTFTHPWATMDVDGQTNKQTKTIKLLLIFLIFIYCYGGSRWMCIQHSQCREWWVYTLHLVLLQSVLGQLRTAGFLARPKLKDKDAQSIKGDAEENCQL